MSPLIAIPVYNEERHLEQVLVEVKRYSDEVLIVNDGSTDGTPHLLSGRQDLHLIQHRRNLGYGAAITSAMAFAAARGYAVLITMDCDGQHEPSRIPVLLEALDCNVDIVSGSRYLRCFRQDASPPPDRRRINHLITQDLNRRFDLGLTDAFCGFKAYRVAALRQLHLTETGWGMPLQLWIQAAMARPRLRIKEVGVPRLYLDPQRAFGGTLNDPEIRLRYYREVIEREAARQSKAAVGGEC